MRKLTYSVPLVALIIICILSGHSINIKNFAESVKISTNNISRYDLSATTFHKWGSENTLTLQEISTNRTQSFLKLAGNTGNSSSGFVTDPLNLRGSNVEISIGSVSKLPEESRISYSFDVAGLFKNYTLVFVLGRSYFNGWTGDQYFQNLNENSDHSFNLSDIVATHNGLYLMTRKISIVVEGQTKIDGLNFGIKFGNPKLVSVLQ